MVMLFQWRGIAVDGMRLDVPMMFSEQLLRCKFGVEEEKICRGSDDGRLGD